MSDLLESLDFRYLVDVLVYTTRQYILRVHPLLCRNKVPLLLCGVATTSTVPASLIMGDQPLYS